MESTKKLLPDFKNYFKVTIIKQWYHCEVWLHRVECPEIAPHINGWLIFDKGASQFSGERIVFSTDSAGTIEYQHA